MSDQNASPTDKHKCTPPPKFKVRNPFDKALISRLHTPICSPGMCKIYKKKSGSTFRWDIDQACTLAPADIVACSSQFEPSPDPVLEKIAEEATERYFSQNDVMPSPFDTLKKIKPLQISHDASIHMDSDEDGPKLTRDASVQTLVTLPPILPPELQALLESYSTYTQDQNMSYDYEMSANGSLRRKLLFEEHSDAEHYDSEQTDDELHVEKPSPCATFETHTPVVFSPDLSRDLVAKGMRRTFGTPLNKAKSGPAKGGFRNKFLDSVEFGEPSFSPIEFRGTPGTPCRMDHESASSLASESISPVNKVSSSDDEKHNFTSPESEAMATCLECASYVGPPRMWPCVCKATPQKAQLVRSASLKESPLRQKRSTSRLSDKRSLSMSSLNRSRSVQKLDFSFDMSVDDSCDDHSGDDLLRCHSALAGSESTPSPPKEMATWSSGVASRVQLSPHAGNDPTPLHYKTDTIPTVTYQSDTPVKGKSKTNILTHVISQIRQGSCESKELHAQMSLDSSVDGGVDNPLDLEDKKMDFNNIDLNFLTGATCSFNFSRDVTKTGEECTASFKRIDSGFNEGTTFYASTSSYYESAIKPSELTVTDCTKTKSSKKALREISNVNWMRADSGFKDETSSDSVQFYPSNSVAAKGPSGLSGKDAVGKAEDKENVFIEDFDKFLSRASGREEAMSISDIFADEMAFNCNFSSTPSKNKVRN